MVVEQMQGRIFPVEHDVERGMELIVFDVDGVDSVNLERHINGRQVVREVDPIQRCVWVFPCHVWVMKTQHPARYWQMQN